MHQNVSVIDIKVGFEQKKKKWTSHSAYVFEHFGVIVEVVNLFTSCFYLFIKANHAEKK